MRRLRVLHVIGGGDTGGAMTYLLPLLSGLRRERCDAQLLCLGAGGLAEEAARRGLPVEVLPMANPWDVRVLPYIRRRLNSGAWDAVHTHGMRANQPIRAIMRTLRRPPALFTTVHSDLALDYPLLQAWAYMALDRLTAGEVDGFFCVSAELAGRLAARGVPRRRIHVVYPGVEVPPAPYGGGPAATANPAAATPPSTATPAATAPVRDTAAGSSQPSPVIGTVARLVAVKDLGLLLETAKRLAPRRPGLRVLVIGDGPERAALEREAATLGLERIVEFRGEVRPVWAALAELDVYVLTSLSEGVPISVLEAMSVGLPVVAASVGGLPEVIQEGVTGYLVERNAPRAAIATLLAERIEALLADRDLRARMGAAGRQRVAETFSIAAAARLTLRVYGRAVAERSDRGGF